MRNQKCRQRGRLIEILKASIPKRIFICVLVCFLILAGCANGAPEPVPETTLPLPEPTHPVQTEPSIPETIPETQPSETEPPEMREVPLIFQTDYPDIPFRGGTIATSGCSMASLSMVATAVTGQEVYPDGLVGLLEGCSGTAVELLEAGCVLLDLPVRNAYKWSGAVGALRYGKLVIVLLNSGSPLTDGQHFVVLTGITEDGRILVHDPYEPNYAKENLADGFANGFAQEDISAGFDGAWIFDRAPTD